MENYLLIGQETGDIKEFINQIIQNNPESEVRKFITKDSIENIQDFLNEESLFVSSRICIVTAVSDLDVTFTKFVNSYMSKPKVNATFILNLENFKQPAGIKKGFKKENIKTYYPMFDSERITFVRSLLSKERITIDSDALTVFLDMCENTKLSMKITVDQVVAFIRSRSETAITREHLLTFLSHTRVEDVQSLYFAILDRKKETAIRIVRVLLNSRSYEASMIAIRLGYDFLALLKVQETIENGEVATKDALSSIKYFKLRQLSEKALRYYSKSDLENILFNLANIDIPLKESDFEMKVLLLENLILNIINKNFYDKDYLFTETL